MNFLQDIPKKWPNKQFDNFKEKNGAQMLLFHKRYIFAGKTT
jgi:hypothetical protein